VTNDSVRKVSLSAKSTTEIAKLSGKRLLRIVGPRQSGSWWSPDKNKFLIVATRDEQSNQAGFYKIELSSGKATRLIEQNMDFGDFPTPQIEVTQSRGSILYIVEDTQHCKDIWITKADFSAPPRRVTNSNPLFDRYVMGESRLIEWYSSDGSKLRGALLLPANYRPGSRYPLIVNVYGGELLSNQVNQFGFSWSPVLNMQLLATRGYAVLLPDSILRPGTPMTDIPNCVLPGVNKVIEMGIADPEKLGVMGSSYGGYSTLALIVQTNRFKAAISDAGLASLIGIYSHLMRTGEAGYMGWAESGRGNMGGSLWKYRERFVENSPLFYLDRVQTPLLILQGTDDDAAPTFLADELFASLQRLGKEATYVRYQGEGHTLTHYSRAAQIDYLTRVFTWFDTWFKGPRTEPEISKQ
jgi:dipeptidyl aminopeptidase/acylaminoacyl peptidase